MGDLVIACFGLQVEIMMTRSKAKKTKDLIVVPEEEESEISSIKGLYSLQKICMSKR